ncbi:MAG: glutathione ABC transporter permease GsiC [Desulfuromonadales bacterium C00003107]|nr:MAG: glutathione ABC transporter permease GsiC [Desulfuromonadales bacterium C00003107]
MLDYILKRILQLIPVLLLVSVVSFSIIYFAPGDPAETLCTGPDGSVNPESVEKFRNKMGLDKPLHIQYLIWLNNLLHGDLGYSYRSQKPVFNHIKTAFRATFKLSVVSLFLSLAIAIPLGIISAIKQNSPLDVSCMVGASLGVSMPNFWLGLLLMLLFGIYLDLLPVAGYGDGGDLEHIILPAITLGTGSAAVTARLIRSSMLEALGQDYIQTARAKGVSERVVIGKHALKNALIPVVTMVGLNFGYLLNGSVVVETIFGWPGLGRLIIDSIDMRDYMMIQGCMVFVTLLFVLVNLIVDISYRYIDPRIRYETAG